MAQAVTIHRAVTARLCPLHQRCQRVMSTRVKSGHTGWEETAGIPPYNYYGGVATRSSVSSPPRVTVTQALGLTAVFISLC